MTNTMRLMALDEKARVEQAPRKRGTQMRYRHPQRTNKRSGWPEDKGFTVSPQQARAARPYIFGEED